MWWYWNYYKITGDLWGEPTSEWPMPLTRPIMGSYDVSLMLARTTSWTNSQVANDLRCHDTHCNVVGYILRNMHNVYSLLCFAVLWVVFLLISLRVASLALRQTFPSAYDTTLKDILKNIKWIIFRTSQEYVYLIWQSTSLSIKRAVCNENNLKKMGSCISWIMIYLNKGKQYHIHILWDILYFNTLRPRQNCRHFADDIFKFIFLNENAWISFKIWLKFVAKVPVSNIPALVQIMVWCRPGDKPLSEPMMVSLLTQICVTRPQWVKEQILQISATSSIVNISNHIIHAKTVYKWHYHICHSTKYNCNLVFWYLMNYICKDVWF